MSFLRKLLSMRSGVPVADGYVAMRLSQAYARVFLDGNGKLTEDAQIVVADLCKQGQVVFPIVARKVDGSISTEDILINEGKRIVVLGVLRRIFKRFTLGDEINPEEEDNISQTLNNEILHQ